MGLTKELIWTLALMALVLVGAALLATALKRSSREQPRAKSLMTHREQAMHKRLRDALPEHHVLAQVAFSALLTAKARGTRNTFDRKVADFVVCNNAFNVVTIIELDDASHKGRESQDKARDAMLQRAGYRTMRFKNVPDVDEVVTAIRAMQ